MCVCLCVTLNGNAGRDVPPETFGYSSHVRTPIINQEQRLADLQGLIAVSVSMALHVTHHHLSFCQFPDLFIIDASFLQSILIPQALSQHTNFPIKAMEEQQMKKPIKNWKVEGKHSSCASLIKMEAVQ